MSSYKGEDNTFHNKEVAYYQEPKHATLLVWIGVSMVSLFIMVLWTVNAYSLVTDIMKQPTSQEQQLFNTIATDFDAVILTTQEKEKDEKNEALVALEASIVEATATKAKEDATAVEEVKELLKTITVETPDTSEE